MLVRALECIESIELKRLTSLVLQFHTGISFLVIQTGQLMLVVINIIGYHLHWLDFDIAWLKVVVCEPDVASRNFHHGWCVLIASLLLCGRNALVLNLLDLHSDYVCSLNLN